MTDRQRFAPGELLGILEYQAHFLTGYLSDEPLIVRQMLRSLIKAATGKRIWYKPEPGRDSNPQSIRRSGAVPLSYPARGRTPTSIEVDGIRTDRQISGVYLAVVGIILLVFGLFYLVRWINSTTGQDWFLVIGIILGVPVVIALYVGMWMDAHR